MILKQYHQAYIKSTLLLAVLSLFGEKAVAQMDTVVYYLTIDQKKVSIGGKESRGMTINGSIPGPTLRFIEGQYAVIYVKNEMKVETSVHWHGLLLPNFMDGVPYLTTPPIEPGSVFKYEFPLIQAGTYWYHSHTALQEQSGVYGSIVIEAKEEKREYDTDLVLVLSDWTYEKPQSVLKTLKRGLEIYDIQKGTSVPISQVIARGALGAQLNFWRQRMEGADIADVYYPAYLTNGKIAQEYPQFRPGEKVRIRFINAAASSQFWLTFGGEEPLLIAADGLDVVAVTHPKTFIAVAETYDFIVTIPQNGKMEVRATAQDGSGQTSAFLGQGKVLPAPAVARPDKIAMMQQMAAMNMRMGAPATKFNPSNEEPYKMMNAWGMDMEDAMEMPEMKDMKRTEMHKEQRQSNKMKRGKQMPKDSVPTKMVPDNGHMNHQLGVGQKSAKEDKPRQMNMVKDSVSSSKMNHSAMDPNVGSGQKEKQMPMAGMQMFAEYNYNFLKAVEETEFPKDKPVREILLNLTGNMVRYIWSLNGVPLSEADKIKIQKGEITRITLNNLTMMHHPMHLHGHFFRVINEHGEYSPLKHTVNVAPMQKVTIEFNANEYGDWFFHCHILYHLDAGMARIFSYETAPDKRLKNHPLRILTNQSNHFFTWGIVDVASHMTELNIVSSNIRNQFNLRAEYGWNKKFEGELTYGRYLYDYFSVFAGVNVENSEENAEEKVAPTAIMGVRYLTPYLFNLEVLIDSRLRPQLRLAREVLVLPRTFLFGEFEYQANFGWRDNYSGERPLGSEFKYQQETNWSLGMEYLVSKTFSLMGSYDNRFGVGGGVTVRF